MNTSRIVRAVDALIKQFPTLDIHGLCVPLRHPTQQSASRGDIIKDATHHHRQIDACIEWLGMCPKTRGFQSITDSYSFKHEVEHWQRATGRPLGATHLSFLLAAQIAGFELKQRNDHVGERPHCALLKLSGRRPGSSWDIFRQQGSRAVPPWMTAIANGTPVRLSDGRHGVIQSAKERDGLIEYYVKLDSPTANPYWYGLESEFTEESTQ